MHGCTENCQISVLTLTSKENSRLHNLPAMAMAQFNSSLSSEVISDIKAKRHRFVKHGERADCMYIKFNFITLSSICQLIRNSHWIQQAINELCKSETAVSAHLDEMIISLDFKQTCVVCSDLFTAISHRASLLNQMVFKLFNVSYGAFAMCNKNQ